ncbi:MAG: TIGR03915 family putative DNA repair protein [Clostridiaceae bacterium]
MKMMLFDGSMEELLIAVYKVYVEKADPILYRKEDFIMNLIDEPIEILYDEDAFNRVRKAIQDKFLEESLDTITYALKNNSTKSPTLVLKYIISCFTNPKEGINYQNNIVLEVIKMSRQVELESHRFMGFVRFSEIDGIYVSKINPDHDILEFLAPHFTSRFQDQKFIIYDEKRRKALISQNGEALFRNDIELDSKFLLRDSFAVYWKEYYDNIAIKERRNPKAQKRSMPIRYWDNLIETKNDEPTAIKNSIWNPLIPK